MIANAALRERLRKNTGRIDGNEPTEHTGGHNTITTSMRYPYDGNTWPDRPLFEWGAVAPLVRERTRTDRTHGLATSRYKFEDGTNDPNENSTEYRNAERTKTLRL